MVVLYVTEQGATLKKDGKRIVVEKSGEQLLSVPLIHIDRVIVFGNVQLTGPVIAMLLEGNVDVAFLSVRGKLRGNLRASKSKNVFLRMAQYDRFKDSDFRIQVASQIIKAKISNQRQILLRYQRSHPEVDFSETVERLGLAAEQVSSVYGQVSESSHATLPMLSKAIQILMGIEGQASSAYFSAFGKMLRGELEFRGRQYRPSPDPINGLLSLGYSMLTNEIASILEAHSFDPLFGLLHGVRYGRKSLALDIVEEFRQPVIDRFTLRLLNLRIFKDSDFQRHSNGGVYLTEDVIKKYFAEYEQYIQQQILIGDQSKQSFRQIFRKQVLNLEKAVMNRTQYEPFISPPQL